MSTAIVCPVCEADDDIIGCGFITLDVRHYECGACLTGFDADPDAVPENGSGRAGEQ